MHRTVISLTEAQVEAIRRRCARTGQSMAAVIRDAVDRELARVDDWEAVTRRARATIAGSHLDLGGDASVTHDEILVESVEDERRNR